MPDIINTPILPDTEQVSASDPIRDKEGVAIWKKIQKTNGEITDAINTEFKNKYHISFSEWTSRKGLLNGIGKTTDQTQENLDKIIAEIEK